MSRRQNRRHAIKIIDKKLQGRIVLRTSIPPLIVLALTSFLFAFFSRRLGHEALVADVELPSLSWMLASAGFFLLAATGFLGIHALILSQRLAGPLHAIRRTVRAYREVRS